MTTVGPQRTYILAASAAVVGAAVFPVLAEADDLPGIGTFPLLPLTVAAAVIGLPCLMVLTRRGLAGRQTGRIGGAGFGSLLLLGGLLALPPVALDVAYGFAPDLNVPLPEALVFYIAAAIISVVAFHLAPLAALAVLLPHRAPVALLFLPVVFAEPGFHAWAAAGGPVPAALVFVSVSLVSACQLWLFWRFGFAAMIGLRLVYYAAWHIAWGSMRLGMPL